MKIKSHFFWCESSQCQTTFQTLGQAACLDNTGQLLLSRKSHLPALIKIDDDSACKTVWEIVQKVLYPEEVFESEVATRFGRVFGQICDLAPDRSAYDMSGRRYCPNSGSSNMRYGPTDPPIITHKKWAAMSPGQQLTEVKPLLETYKW